MNPNRLSRLVVRWWPKSPRASRLVCVAIALLLVGLTGVYWNHDASGNESSRTGVLVLEDCDRDFRNPPFEDVLMAIRPGGKPVRKVADLNICETVGGCRMVSVAENGRLFTISENVGNKLTAYDLNTGQPRWSLSGPVVSATEFNSALVAPDGKVYALTSVGTIYGDRTLVIDETGHITRQAKVGGFDLALDADREALWLVGKTIKKCDLKLNVAFEITPIRWCAVSVDLNRDGSIWVAERDHPDVVQSTNRILKVSSTGQILKSVGLPFSPLCVRVDRSDDSVWVTGVEVKESSGKRLLASVENLTGRLPTGKRLRDLLTRPNLRPQTHKYDGNGAVRFEIKQGGHSIDVDPNDGSCWIAGADQVFHYSRQGKRLAQWKTGSTSQKYVVVLPGSDPRQESGASPNTR